MYWPFYFLLILRGFFAGLCEQNTCTLFSFVHKHRQENELGLALNKTAGKVMILESLILEKHKGQTFTFKFKELLRASYNKML